MPITRAGTNSKAGLLSRFSNPVKTLPRSCPVIPWSAKGGYDLYDMVSSPLAQVTQDSWLERRPERRIWPVYFEGSNFGVIDFLMGDDPRLVFQLIDIHGRRVREPFELHASELVNGVTSWPSKVTDLPRQRQEHLDAGEGYYEIPVED
jgi:alkaline phosphatase D